MWIKTLKYGTIVEVGEEVLKLSNEDSEVLNIDEECETVNSDKQLNSDKQ